MDAGTRKIFGQVFGQEPEHMDSTGKAITVGDRVKFRGQVYTIKEFGPKEGQFGTSIVRFEEDQHVPEVADEFSVDVV